MYTVVRSSITVIVEEVDYQLWDDKTIFKHIWSIAESKDNNYVSYYRTLKKMPDTYINCL